MALPSQPPHQVRFGVFELDLQTGELCNNGHKFTLQEQSFQVLAVLLEHPGRLVTREELKKKLWPSDTFVDFDQGLNKVVNRLRDALGDSAEDPRFIETLPRKGYRFVASAQKVTASGTSSQAAAAPLSNLIGKKASHYRVLGLLGGGGMGLVYQAEDLKLGRRVALKFLPEELAKDTVALERFEHEARAASALNHPNICIIYATEEHEGQPLLAMELLEGETLRELISAASVSSHQISDQEGPLRLDQLLDIAVQVTSGLEAAHQKGIIHRDIKPANIFVTSQGQAKILDFGLAKLYEFESAKPQQPPSGEKKPKQEWNPSLTLTRTGMMIGTAGYMSPEQVRGDKLDARTDLFSFGIVLYEMATGKRAFMGETAPVLREAIINHTPTPVGQLNSRIPPKLEDIINKALEKDRNLRYQNASEMKADLERLRRDKGARFGRVPRQILWFATVLLFLGITGVLVWQSPRFHGGPAAPASSKTLAVIEIENLSLDPSLNWLGNGVVDLLATDLAQAKGLDVISSERIRGLTREKLHPGESLPADRAWGVAKEAGANMFLSGGLLKVDQGLRLDLRIQDTATGKVLFADRVEGDNPQAIFSMVDRATTRIFTELTPAGGAVGASATTGLTSDLDALHAYEDGLSYTDRFLHDEAVASFRRATRLDPEFAMAYWGLGMNLTDSPAEVHQAFDRAAELARTRQLPEQHRVLIEATRLVADGRASAAVPLLQAAARQFPKEVLLWDLLGLSLDVEGRNQEAVAAFEKVLQIDPKSVGDYNHLAYAYARLGDLAHALAIEDQYADLLPPNDPNPIDSRGDIYTLNGRYDDAIGQYSRNLNSSNFNVRHPSGVKIALCYLYEGMFPLAEKAARSEYETSDGIDRAYAASARGDIATAHGSFDRAVDYYEESAKLFSVKRPDFAEMKVWRAAEIYFEQKQPLAALDWARRHPGLGFAEVRGVGYLVLGNKSAAEREFAAVRAAAAPLLGDYEAENIIALDRLRAASYASHWAEVISTWAQLPGNLRILYSFQLGRAYAESAMFPQAEEQLRIALRPLSAETPHQNDLLSHELARFYLGKVLEQENKKAEAISAYRGFLAYFENSSRRLPQIPEAQAALKRLL